MVKLTKLFWKVEKHVLRYLRGTTEYGLWYRRIKVVKLQGFNDVDWVGSPSNRKITSRGMFNIGSTPISYHNRQQISIALKRSSGRYYLHVATRFIDVLGEHQNKHFLRT